MLKLALAFGISAEWLYGPVAASLPALGSATLRAMMFTLAAWAVLEAWRALWRAVLTLEHHR